MQYLTHDNIQQNHIQSNKWLRRIFTTGFVFFFVKGLAWIAVAAWAVYKLKGSAPLLSPLIHHVFLSTWRALHAVQWSLIKLILFLQNYCEVNTSYYTAL